MQIEIIGCTSAGKSSLIQEILNDQHLPGYQLITSYDFVLNWARSGWVKNHRLRMLLLNLIALSACLLTWRENRAFYRFVAGVIWRLPGEVGLREKLKIARIAARNAGIYEIVRRRRSAGQIVLADEGTLHIANYLFVHVGSQPNLANLKTFTGLVSLPDAAVYVSQPETLLVSRTIQRGHKRIPKGAALLASRFIRHSLEVFETLTASSNLAERLVVLNGGELSGPNGHLPHSPQQEIARAIFAGAPATPAARPVQEERI